MSNNLTRSVIRMCRNYKCGFRFPDTNFLVSQLACPVCGSPTDIAQEIDLTIDKRNGNFWKYPNLFVVILDNIRSVYNVGAIFRTALGLGLDKIFLCGITPTPDHKNFHKSSLGADNSIAWEKSLNCIETCGVLHSQSYKLISIETTESAISIRNLDFHDFSNYKIALVVGNEISGIDPEIISLSDLVVDLPINGMNKSYNVTTAFGIAAYQFANILSI